MTSIFEGQPLKTRPFPSKTRVIWVAGIYIHSHTSKSVTDWLLRLVVLLICGTFVSKNPFLIRFSYDRLCTTNI